MTKDSTVSSDITPHSPGAVASVLVMACWFGILTGAGEGVGLVVFQDWGWVAWEVAKIPVSVEIIWISTVVDLLIFFLCGLGLTVLGKVIAKLPLTRVAAFSFVWLLALNWLLITGRLRALGCAILAAGIASVFYRWYAPREPRAIRLFQKTLPAFAGAVLLTFVAFEGISWWEVSRAVAQRPMPPDKTPNVLVIVLDTLRADHLSALGYERRTSPNIDRIASEGVLFENGVATSSWTLPSHATLVTGLYANQHGALGTTFSGKQRTIGEVLQGRGYRTAAFSANLFFFTRNRGFQRGFDTFQDMYHSPVDMFSRTVFGRQYFKRFWDFERESPPFRKLADTINEQFLTWVGERSDRPFFAFLNYFDLHDPYFPPRPFRSRFSKAPRPRGLVNAWADRGHIYLPPDQLKPEISAYDGAISYVDDRIGTLLEELSRKGVLQNTIVIITSDHGESFCEHGLTGHRTSLYWELLRVPIIVWAPGRTPVGQRYATPVSLAAIPATILDLIGEPSQPLPGESLTSFWGPEKRPEQADYPPSQIAYMPWEPMKPAPVYYGAIASVVNEKWHYIRHDTRGEELYEWGADPREEHNMVNTPEGHKVSRRLAAYLDELQEPNARTASGSHREP